MGCLIEMPEQLNLAGVFDETPLQFKIFDHL